MEANIKDIEANWKAYKMLIEAGETLGPEAKIALELIIKNEMSRSLNDVGKVTLQNNNDVDDFKTQRDNLLEMLKGAQNKNTALQDEIDDLKKRIQFTTINETEKYVKRQREDVDAKVEHAKQVYNDFAKTGHIENGSIQFCPRCFDRYGKNVRAVIGFDITTPPSSPTKIFWASFRHLRKNAKRKKHYIPIKHYPIDTDRDFIKNEMIENGTLSHVFSCGTRKKNDNEVEVEIEVDGRKYTQEELEELENPDGWETGPDAKPTRFARRQKAEELNMNLDLEQEQEHHDPNAEKIRRNLDAFFKNQKL